VIKAITKRLLAPITLVTVSFAAFPRAYGASPWVPIELGPGHSGDVRVLMQRDGGGYQVFFKNFGASSVHFSFYIGGVQTSESTSANGRVHLKHGNTAGPLIVHPQAEAGGSIQVHAIEVVLGESDSITHASE